MERVLDGISLCIDAGHDGKTNRCPANPEYYESEAMWKLSEYQKKYLELFGATVIMTRTSLNQSKGLQARGAASQGCALFISNHSNAVGGYMNESIDYPAIYHLVKDNGTSIDEVSEEIAHKLAPVIEQTMHTQQKARVLTRKSSSDRNKDGVMNDNYYGVLHGAYMAGTPGLILEHSFHTNSESVRWLLEDSNLETLARLEAECIASHFAGRQVHVTYGVTAPKPEERFVPYLIRVSGVSKGDVLNIRTLPSLSGKVVGELPYNDPNVYTIVEECHGWGKLKSGAGWIKLKYTKKL